jgi:hypothetical protein
MVNKKSILFITTQYRAGERIYPIIPQLAKDYNLDLLKIYHMHPQTGKWGGNIDMREIFDKKYKEYFSSVFTSIDKINFPKYNLILADDCRLQSGLGEIYNKRECLMIGNSHGNNAFNYPIINYQKCFDGCFVFGLKEITHEHLIPGGIPSNDELIKYKDIKKKHILIITGFIGNKPTYQDPTGFKFLPFDRYFFDNIDILKIQNIYKKPVIIKVKSRENDSYQETIEYLNSILPKDLKYEVIFDIEDDNKLVAESEIVIGAPSTLSLKSIQLNIPTILIKNYGYSIEGSSLYKNYEHLIDLDHDQIIKTLSNSYNYSNFILETIEGGITFNSTFYYINYIHQILNN